MMVSGKLTDQIVELASAIQQIPAPTGSEDDRAAFLAEHLRAKKLADVQIDPAGNVLARIPGLGKQRPLVVSAHLDTVFPKTIDLSQRRTATRIYGPGIGDNSLGVATLACIPALLNDLHMKLPGDLWMVATVGEEGLGNLRGMRAVVDRFDSQALAYIVIEGMGLGEVYHRALAIRRYRMRVQTPGGHSWTDYGQPSAVHELAILIDRITKIPLSQSPRTTLNVGIIAGGSSINTIAASAFFDLDLRSEKVSSLDRLAAEVERLAGAVRNRNVQVDWEVIGERPAGEIPIDHPLVQLTINSLRESGIKPCPGIGSTDASAPLSRAYPAVCIGLTRGRGGHTTNEFIDLRPLKKGVEALARTIFHAASDLT